MILLGKCSAMGASWLRIRGRAFCDTNSPSVTWMLLSEILNLKLGTDPGYGTLCESWHKKRQRIGDYLKTGGKRSREFSVHLKINRRFRLHGREAQVACFDLDDIPHSSLAQDAKSISDVSETTGAGVERDGKMRVDDGLPGGRAKPPRITAGSLYDSESDLQLASVRVA